MQATLPLLDASTAVGTCPKCQAYVDTRGYHAAFCPCTRGQIHDAFVRELRDFLRKAGATVLLEPMHVLPHAPGDEVTKGRVFRPDLQVTHLDTSGVRYLVDVTTVDVTAATNRGTASKKAGVAATKAEGRKTREYKSKVDGRKTQLIPAAFELCGRWGEGLVMLFKKGIVLATREGRNENGTFATYWKRRLSIVARTTMIQIAQVALRGHLQRHDDPPSLCDDTSDDEMVDI